MTLPASTNSHRKTVLVVDDHRSICELIALHLTILGYHTLTASDGKEALDLIQAKGIESIDLLLTDLEMPRMRGDELAEWFRKEKPLGHVLIMSTHLGDMKTCKDVALLQKPFYPDVLGHHISKLFGNSCPSPSRHPPLEPEMEGTLP